MMMREYRLLGFPVFFDQTDPKIIFRTPHEQSAIPEKDSLELVIRDFEYYIGDYRDTIQGFDDGVFHVRPEFKRTIDNGLSDTIIYPDEEPKVTGSPEYLALLGEMADLHRRKNAGYAGHSDDPWSNFRECEKFGVDCFTGVLVRMSDKWSRITSLVQNPANEQVGESIKDTLKDLSAYALIASILYDEHHDTD